MSKEVRLAEMLCTRLCHDIIGPVGAVSNGAEFLKDELGEVKSDAADLIESSSREAVIRLQFYRQAYGMGSTGSPTSLSEMKLISTNFFTAGKIQLEWDEKYTDISKIQLSYTHKKLVLNLLLMAASALIRGGTINFQVENGQVHIKAAGEKANLDRNYEACLQGKLEEKDIDPRLVQCYYTYHLANEGGTTLAINKTENGVNFSFKI